MEYIQPRFTVSWRTDTGYYVTQVNLRPDTPRPGNGVEVRPIGTTPSMAQ
jgi:hypothetical protein